MHINQSNLRIRRSIPFTLVCVTYRHFTLGGPGSGKGTQCSRVVEEFSYIHLSAGDLLRQEVARGNERGHMIEELIKEGKLVPQVHIIIYLGIHSHS